MDVITKELKYNVERKIEAIKLNESMYCFKEIRKMGETIIFEDEGFTDSINVKNNEDIIHLKGITLMKKEVLDINKNEVGGFYAFDSRKKNNFIELKPYSYITNNPKWLEDYLILDYFHYSRDLRTLDGDYYPKKLFFDYFQELTNEYYDLEKLFKYLKTKESDRLKLVSDGVISIPYYNCHHGIDRQICFEYIPTMEEYTNYKKNLSLDDMAIKNIILEKLGVFDLKEEDRDYYED